MNLFDPRSRLVRGRRRTRQRAVVVLGAVAALVLGVAPVSSATALETNNVTAHSWAIGKDLCSIGPGAEGSAYGVACFQPSGDWLDVVDGESDGQRVGMQWKAGSRNGLCVNTRGRERALSPYSLSYSSGYGCNKGDLAENLTIYFRVGRCDGSRVNCASPANWSWRPYTSWSVGG